MGGMQGWPSHRQLDLAGEQSRHASASPLSGRDGSVLIGVGAVLLVAAVVLTVLTFRSPSFDPSGGLRAPVSLAATTIDVPHAGRYAAYVEAPECTSGEFDLVREGQPDAPRESSPDPGLAVTRHDGVCGTPAGIFQLTPGSWTALLPASTSAASVVLYDRDHLPRSPEFGSLWMAGAAAAAGAVLLVLGARQRARWRRQVADAAR